MSSVHVPVLLEQVKEFLLPVLQQPTDLLVDCTFGGGGHSSALLQASEAKVLGLDQDQQALKAGESKFSDSISKGRLELRHINFSDFFGDSSSSEAKYSGILADLGFSSDQLEDSQRGLSFQQDGPLDMRLNCQDDAETAFEYLSRVRQDELALLVKEYGEERFCGRIARVICEARDAGELEDSTKALAERIARAVPKTYRYGRIHPATRSFQAIRIAVNDELGALDSLLKHAIISLRPGGRMAVISFHSLEDRRVKLRFRELKNNGFRVLTPKPVIADENEVAKNSRARSAKMRVIERV